jgi:hypothetical protein
MKKSIRNLTLLSSLCLVGCATVFTGTTQQLHIQAVSSVDQKVLTDAKCTLTDSNGIAYIASSIPGVVTVQKGQGPLKAECTKPGYHQKTVGVGENFNKVTLVNVFFWPGFIVDAVAGTLQKYPSHVSVTMEPNSAK